MEFHPDRDYQLMAARFLPNFCEMPAKSWLNPALLLVQSF